MLLLDDDAKHEIFTQLDIDPEATFKILKPLGEGAYGAVFKALDTRDDQLVALKVMRFDPEECQDLLSEIKILRECKNENIVNFKDTFHKDGNLWLAMEFCEGGSTLDIIKVSKHTLSERQCQCVVYHCLKGLQYLHSKNLIHRDIKAANILINKDGRCKLADFGVAKSVRASGAGTTIGSPYWMAPEVLGTEKYDSSADMWSLGIASIEMCIGKPPLSNYKPLQAMFMIPKNDSPTIPEDYIDDFSQGFIDFLAKCLAKNPAARPTATQLLQTDPWIAAVSKKDYVEKELMPWMQKVMPLIEKDRDLKARIANQDDSYDDSKWSDYTASLQRLSRDGSYGGATLVKNETLNTRHTLTQTGTLKIVPDDVEDDEDQGTLVRKATDSSYSDEEEEEEEDNFNGDTMITIQTKHELDENEDEEQDEYHENGFSPTTASTVTAVTNTHKHQQSQRDSGGGGGYSIGNKSSFDGNTMVRQNSTDDEEEDPFQGQTMYRAPTVDSPHGVLLLSDDDDNNSVIIANDDNDTVTSMGTTKPEMSVSPKNAFIAPNGTLHMMSDDEETGYENTRGYANKPSSPLSGETIQPPMAKVKRKERGGGRGPMSPSDTPQPTDKDIIIGTAGPMGGSIAAETKRGSLKHKVRSGRISGGTHDVEIPTSPIPHYKHMQILTDDHTEKEKGKEKEKDGLQLEHIQQFAILANQLDFSKLVTNISCTQHLLVIIGVLTTWIFIVSYITLECSDRKRPREMQLFIFASAVSILFNLLFNPFYFKKFANKYVPLTVEQLFEKTQPRFASSSLGLRVVVDDMSGADGSNRKLKGGSDDISDDGSDETETRSAKSWVFTALVTLLRCVALICALGLSYFIYLDLSIEQYTNFTRYCIVALTLMLFVGNLPLMGHCMLYYRKTFLIYYLMGWIIVCSSEFSYFHFVRHVEEEYFHTFILLNIIFFVFHLISTTWFSHMLKHRNLYLLDPLKFPNSNHYRVYFANTVIAADGYVANTAAATRKKETNGSNIGFRTVSCCCNKLICDSHTMLRFQSYAAAVSFWSFLGIIYTVGFEYVVLSASLFMLINTMWNPLFYSKEIEYITADGSRCFCWCKKWIYYVMLIVSYIVGCVLNVAWCTFSISAFILEDGKQIEHATIINIIIFLFAAVVFFLPSIGYSFYRIPISYAVCNIFGALFCFGIPICISFEPGSQDDLSQVTHSTLAKVFEDWFFIYDYETYDISSTSLGIIICVVIFATYLAFTGLSCVTYRVRKVLTERSKSYFKKEFPMNMIMFWSFLLSFAVFVSNSLWVWGDNFGPHPYHDSISIIAKLVYCVSVCVQSSSLMYSIFSLKHQFYDDSSLTPYLSDVADKIRKHCGFCCFLLLFPVIYVSYLLFIVLMSFVLGITKVLTIRQVHDYWLSFLIADYDDIKMQNTTNRNRDDRQPNTIQALPTNSEIRQTNTEHAHIEVMALNNQINLGESTNYNHSMNLHMTNPMSPNTDLFEFEANDELHRRVSSTASRSVNMKVYKCCDCCTPSWMSSLSINESVYNNYLISELIVEALPLLMLNIVNMLFLYNRITIVALTQSACCVLFLFYSICKTLFYVRFHEWDLAKFLSN